MASVRASGDATSPQSSMELYLPQKGFIKDYHKNLGVERMECFECSPDLNSTERDQLTRAVCSRAVVAV